MLWRMAFRVCRVEAPCHRLLVLSAVAKGALACGGHGEVLSGCQSGHACVGEGRSRRKDERRKWTLPTRQSVGHGETRPSLAKFVFLLRFN